MLRGDETQTELRPGQPVSKTLPDIKLRGRLDSLMARAVLTAAYAEHFGYSNINMGVKDIVRVVRVLQTAEALDEVPQVGSILGLTFDELRAACSNPRAELGLDHYSPGSDTDLMTAYINMLRVEARSVELDFCAAPATEVYSAIQTILNRLSSAAYVLMLECRSERI